MNQRDIEMLEAYVKRVEPLMVDREELEQLRRMRDVAEELVDAAIEGKTIDLGRLHQWIAATKRKPTAPAPPR